MVRDYNFVIGGKGSAAVDGRWATGDGMKFITSRLALALYEGTLRTYVVYVVRSTYSYLERGNLRLGVSTM